MYGIFFKSGTFSFVDPDEFTTPAMERWKALFEATPELAAVGAGLKLDSAPLASWVLARFAWMTESTMFPKDAVRREGELGGFRLRMLAVRGVEPIAKLRFAAECGRAELYATGADQASAAEAARALIAALAADPTSLERIEIQVRAAELGGVRNAYGFDGATLLGRHNAYA